jgi:hypothetical protein
MHKTSVRSMPAARNTAIEVPAPRQALSHQKDQTMKTNSHRRLPSE